MKDLFIESLTPESGTVVLFAQASQVDRKETKGKPYLALKLRDRTGELEARLWDIPEGFSCQSGDFLKVQALCHTYKEVLQLKVVKVRTLDRSEVSIEDFIPASKRNRAEMLTQLYEQVDSILDEQLRIVVYTLIGDHAEDLMNAPAARKMHQAYLGGLLEHMLALCGLVDAVCKVYPDLNRDVLLAGMIVHDIGKVKELSFTDSIGTTRRGQLLGHIIQGSMMWEDVRRRVNVDPALADHVAHIIVSHHGCKDWGSPVIPATREAQVAHLLDMIDSRMSICTEQLASQPVDADGFTGRIHALETALWNGGNHA